MNLNDRISFAFFSQLSVCDLAAVLLIQLVGIRIFLGHGIGHYQHAYQSEELSHQLKMLIAAEK